MKTHTTHILNTAKAHSLPKTMSKTRRNFYVQPPEVFDAFKMAIKRKIIKATSVSHRITMLMKRDLRASAKACKAAKIALPQEVFEK
jgi:hypothetical protein